MELLDWLNEQKLPLLGEELKKRCSLLKLEKVEDLKKHLTTLSELEIVKLFNVPMSFEALADGAHLLNSLRDYELDRYSPWTETKGKRTDATFKPNFSALEFEMDVSNATPTTMEEIVKKWSKSGGEYEIVSHSSDLDSYIIVGDSISIGVTGSRDEKKVAELLEFLRLEFQARMIPTPDISLDFDLGCIVPL